MTLFHYHLVFILDTWDNVFIWLGNESSNSEQEAVQDLAKEYLASSPSKRKGNGLDCFFYLRFRPSKSEKNLELLGDISSIFNIWANYPEFNLLMSSKPLTGTPIITVHQGKEPITFTGFFLGWDDEFWDTDVSDKLQYS